MDIEILKLLNDITGKSIYLDATIIFISVYFPFIFVLGHVWFFYKKRKFGVWLWVWVAVALSFAVKELISIFYFRLRPFEELKWVAQLIKNPMGEASFPSLHSAISFILAFSVFWLNKKWGALFLFGAVLIAFSRVVVGVHFPTDILGGFFLGFLLSLIVGASHLRARKSK